MPAVPAGDLQTVVALAPHSSPGTIPESFLAAEQRFEPGGRVLSDVGPSSQSQGCFPAGFRLRDASPSHPMLPCGPWGGCGQGRGVPTLPSGEEARRGSSAWAASRQDGVSPSRALTPPWPETPA